MSKLCIWSLFYILYFNLTLNLPMVSIWSLTFLYRINFVFAIISWMKIIDQLNAEIKNWDKLPSHSKSFHFYWDECHMQITQSNYNFLSQFCSFFFSLFFRLSPQHHWIRCLNLPLFFSDNDFLICRKIEANWNLSKLKQIHIKICSTNKLIVHLWFQSTLTVWKTHIIKKRSSTELLFVLLRSLENQRSIRSCLRVGEWFCRRCMKSILN